MRERERWDADGGAEKEVERERKNTEIYRLSQKEAEKKGWGRGRKIKKGREGRGSSGGGERREG